MELVEQFRQYLKDKKVSVNTVKNYVSDLSTFVDYLKTTSQYFSILTLPFILDSETLSGYKQWLEKKDPVSTANRRLSSLRKFIVFAIETNSISKDYTGQVTNLLPLTPNKSEQTLETLNTYLETHVTNTETIKEYKNDINDYLIANTPPRLEILPLEQRPFSPQKFWQWKNQKSSVSDDHDQQTTSTPRVSKSSRWSNFLMTFCAVTILLSLITLILVIYQNQASNQNNRPRAFGDFGFSHDFDEIRNFSLNLSNQLTSALPTPSSKVIDPTVGKTQAIPTWSNFGWIKSVERTWSILWRQISQPQLLDPTSNAS